MRDNIKEDLEHLIGFFQNYKSEEDLENSAQHQVRLYIRDCLKDFGLSKTESNKLSVLMDVNIADQLYQNYHEQITILAYEIAKMAYFQLQVLDKDFGGTQGIDRQKILERISSELSLDISL